MITINIPICADSTLEARAQSVLADLGMDMTTAFNIFLTQVVEARAIPFALPPEPDEGEAATKKIPFSELKDCFKGKIWMADDFDAPLEEMRDSRHYVASGIFISHAIKGQ